MIKYLNLFAYNYTNKNIFKNTCTKNKFIFNDNLYYKYNLDSVMHCGGVINKSLIESNRTTTKEMWNNGTTTKEMWNNGTTIEEMWNNNGTNIKETWNNNGTTTKEMWNNGTTIEEMWNNNGTNIKETWKNNGTTVEETCNNNVTNIKETWNNNGTTVEETCNSEENKTYGSSIVKREKFTSTCDALQRHQIGTKFSGTAIIGEGGFSKVYSAINENGKKFAIKVCKIGKHGINNLLETSIMTSIQHPYLNNAYCISLSTKNDNSNGKMFIIQDLALCDLAHHTRGKLATFSQLKEWTIKLILAVKTLHDNDIIHADIKANNVLLFDDGNIKLNDFTLTVKQWNQETFNHTACTITHRPHECLNKKNWDKSLDIWSLGCTLYEIAYGELLFKFENKNNKEFMKMVKMQYINAIEEWEEKLCSESLHELKLPHKFFKREMQSFNNLLFKMLRCNPMSRWSIDKLLTHPFIQNINFEYPCYVEKFRPIRTIENEKSIFNMINNTENDQIVKDIAFKILKTCTIDIPTSNLIKGCLYIAYKLVAQPKIKQKFNEKLPVIENMICENLNFHFHIFEDNIINSSMFELHTKI